MKKLGLIILTICSQLLISCSHSETATSPPTAGQKHHWVCDSGAIVDWILNNDATHKIQLQLDGGQKLYLLAKVYDTDTGTLYSNGELAFRIKNQSGTLFWANNDEIIGKNCIGN